MFKTSNNQVGMSKTSNNQVGMSKIQITNWVCLKLHKITK